MDFFRSGVITADFRASGKTLVTDSLIISVTNLRIFPFSRHFLRSLVGSGSRTQDFDGELDMIFATSVDEAGVKEARIFIALTIIGRAVAERLSNLLYFVNEEV